MIFDLICYKYIIIKFKFQPTIIFFKIVFEKWIRVSNLMIFNNKLQKTN